MVSLSPKSYFIYGAEDTEVRMQNGLFGRKTSSELLVFLPKDYPYQCCKILCYQVTLVSKYAFVAECSLFTFRNLNSRNPKNSLEYSQKAEFMSHLGNW